MTVLWNGYVCKVKNRQNETFALYIDVATKFVIKLCIFGLAKYEIALKNDSHTIHYRV